MKKRLFREESEAFTKEGKDFSDEIEKAFKPIANKYKEEYCLRDMELIAINTASFIISEIVLRAQLNRDKNKR